MNIRIHVERLILNGLPVEARESALVQAAVEAELTRLLFERGIPGALQTGVNNDRIFAPTLRLNSSPYAKEIGTQIGAGIYNAFGGPSHENS
jgi:hypothetical protein